MKRIVVGLGGLFFFLPGWWGWKQGGDEAAVCLLFALAGLWFIWLAIFHKDMDDPVI